MRKRKKSQNQRKKKSVAPALGRKSVETSSGKLGNNRSGLSHFITYEEALKDEATFKAWQDQYKDWLKGESERLEKILLEYNSFDLIKNLTLTQCAINPENHDVSTHRGLPAIVEYVTLLYLKHPFNVGHLFAIGEVPLAEITEIARSVHLSTGLYYGSNRLLNNSDKQPSPFDSLRYRVMNYEMTVRSPGYEHHKKEQLQMLFGSFSEWMLKELGFCVSDIFSVEDAVGKITSRKLFDRMDKAKEGEATLINEVQQARRRRTANVKSDDAIARLSALSDKKAKLQIKNLMLGWVMSYVGSTCYSFSPDEISEETGLSIERIRAVLAFFSLGFGSIDKDDFLFSPTHELRYKPFIHHEESYLYPVPGSMVWATQSRLEAVLKSENPQPKKQKNWQRYETSRAKYLEQETLRLLGKSLNTEQVFPELNYWVVENEEKKRCELDGLVIFDRTLILVEAKAGGFTVPARRGGRDRIKHDVAELIGKAHNQSLRAKGYIEDSDNPEFFRKDGSRIHIDKKQFQRIILMIVTLDAMDVFNATLHEVASAGLLDDSHLPWAVSLDNLRVISEINEFPTQLIHYLIRRLRINDFKKFYAGDELDWFGLYLQNGLYFEDTSRFKEATCVMFDSSFARPIDDYYLYSQGVRTTLASKPTQPMPDLMRQIIFELEARKDSVGHTEVILQLLNLDDKSRDDLSSCCEEIRRRSLIDHKNHDFSIISSHEKTGLTCLSAPYQLAEEAMSKLCNYVAIKKYQMRANEWTGLLTLVGVPELVHGFIFSDETWTHNVELEKLAMSMPSATNVRRHFSSASEALGRLGTATK